MIIDVHTHIGVNLKRLFSGLYPPIQAIKDLLIKMDIAGVNYSVSFPFESSLYDDPRDYYENIPTGLMEFPYQIENQVVLDHVKNLGEGRILPFISIDPKRKVREQLTQIKTWVKKYKIYGVKVHTKSTKTKGSELINSPFLKEIRRNNWPMLFHSYMQDVAHPLPILEFALKNSDIRVCVAHMGGGIKDFYDELIITKPKNLFIDLSPFLANGKDLPFDSKTRGYEILDLDYEEPIKALRELIYRFGDYIVFGSDEPFTTYINPIEPSLEHRSTLTEEVDLIKKLSKPEFKMMAETNPKRFLGVKLKL